MYTFWASSDIWSASLPKHCTPEYAFLTRISSDFHTCIPTPLAFLSVLLGSLSIVSWLFAQLPQIFKNYSLKSTSGLSIYFLTEWLLGDATNLFGALLTNQATWQVLIAMYYVFVDCALVIQYIWYTHYQSYREKKERLHGGNQQSRDHDNGRRVLDGVSISNTSSTQLDSSDGKNGDAKLGSKPLAVPFSNFRFPAFSSSPREKGTPSSSTSNPTIHRVHHSSAPSGPSPKTLLLISMLCAVLSTATPIDQRSLSPTEAPRPIDTQFIGRILSWTSTILYLGSRLPQLYKNHIRRSTTGLSASLFIAAFFGNLCYSSSLATNPLAWSSYPAHGLHGWVGPEGSSRSEWVGLAAPFFLGAAGVLALDAAVGVQFLSYGEREAVVRVRDERGRGHWRKVSGWMRGWVPSVSPGGTGVVVIEERSGLLERGNGDRDGEYGTG